MAKRKGDKLTLDEVEDMIEEGVLSVDEESECSEDEDFEPVSSNLPSCCCCCCCCLPDPFEGWGHGGRPWSPRSRATPQGLDQRS